MSNVRRVRRGGLLSAIVAALFIPYAFTKGYLTTVIINEGWQLYALTPVETARLFHLVETVPVLFMLLGFVSLDELTVTSGTSGRIGSVTVIAGFGLTIITHLGEHLLPPVTIPVLAGGENVFVFAYYLSWLVLSFGLALYGLALVDSGQTPRWLQWWLISLLPGTVIIGVLVSALDAFTFAGTFRVIHSFTWVVVGGWLYRGPMSWPVPSGEDLMASPDTDDR